MAAQPTAGQAAKFLSTPASFTASIQSKFGSFCSQPSILSQSTPFFTKEARDQRQILNALEKAKETWLICCKGDQSDKQYAPNASKCIELISTHVSANQYIIINKISDLERYGLKKEWVWISKQLEKNLWPESSQTDCVTSNAFPIMNQMHGNLPPIIDVNGNSQLCIPPVLPTINTLSASYNSTNTNLL